MGKAMIARLENCENSLQALSEIALHQKRVALERTFGMKRSERFKNRKNASENPIRKRNT